MDDDLIREFVEVTDKINQLEDQLAPLVKRRKEMQDALQTEFARSGSKRTNMGGYTVYVAHEIWASYPNGQEAAMEALQATGHHEYIKPGFNHQSVSSLVRKLVKGEDDSSDDELIDDPKKRLPPEWIGRLEFTEKFPVKAVKAN